MNNKSIYFIAGLGFLFLSLIGLKDKIDSYLTQLNGQLLTVKVTYVPICQTTKFPHFFKFQYEKNGIIKNGSKRIGGKLCDELIVGQELKLKADLDKDIFLYEKEDVRIEFVSMFILGILGIFLLVLAIKK